MFLPADFLYRGEEMAGATSRATANGITVAREGYFPALVGHSVAQALQGRYVPTENKDRRMDKVTDNAARQRYELKADGGIAVAYYEARGETMVFTHTVVPEKLQGQGLASRLIKGALDDVRRRGLKIVAQCPFVARYIDRHPEERDLLAA
jgi:predicted GNAT family acetyltransferase